MTATPETIARFMSYVDRLPCGCWYWQGARSRGAGNKKWYGSFWYEGRSIRAHRFSAEEIAKQRPLIPGEHRDHTCHFSMCVYPGHIEIVSREENEERKRARKFPHVEYGTYISEQRETLLRYYTRKSGWE